MLKIRLSRIGRKKRPFYRVVVVDERAKRTGAYIEVVGNYNPLTEPKDINLKQDRIDYWLKVGAQMSDGLLRILGKAPKRKERPAKKQKAEGSGDQSISESAETAKSESVKAIGEVESASKEGVAEEVKQEENR